ncbi:hypothetical protein WICMUC_003376 [Wickerhamomyces mucosus]|uniref:Uncharacterized protein n=1 Tax=Wickerhamomyces mucosus TaxID=1378264 RepID=A0A9P8PMQ4_9ASCO|nr:hypothetical protein WICMUC_003376 [Wickerhamomyces mucosus]
MYRNYNNRINKKNYTLDSIDQISKRLTLKKREIEHLKLEYNSIYNSIFDHLLTMNKESNQYNNYNIYNIDDDNFESLEKLTKLNIQNLKTFNSLKDIGWIMIQLIADSRLLTVTEILNEMGIDL